MSERSYRIRPAEQLQRWTRLQEAYGRPELIPSAKAVGAILGPPGYGTLQTGPNQSISQTDETQMCRKHNGRASFELNRKPRQIIYQPRWRR